ncbi:MAG: NAD(P)/FAD-dependent oxidoreductase [Myxococcota bacterium]
MIGSGPAGSAAALRLARLGHHVVMIDRLEHPRDKVCGEGLMPHGVAALAELGIDPPLQAQRFRGIRWSAGGVTAIGVFPNGSTGLGLDRRAFDQVMCSAAEAHARVTLRAPLTARGLEVTDDGVAVQTDEGPISARVLVAADGLHSQVRLWVRLEREARGRKRYGVRQHLRLAEGRAIEEWVDVELVAGAELYLTPVGPQEVNVAALCERDAAKELKGEGGSSGALARWIASSMMVERFEGAQAIDEVRVTGPLRQVPSGVVADRVVLVGDAAGFLDGITGEGMSTSLASAALAAEVVSGALKAGSRCDAAALAPYAEAHAALVRDGRRLTEIILFGIGRRWIAERAVRNLARRPELFDRLLAIETGGAPLSSLGWWGLFGLVGP